MKDKYDKVFFFFGKEKKKWFSKALNGHNLAASYINITAVDTSVSKAISIIH